MLNPIGLTHKNSMCQNHYLEPEFAYAEWVIVHASDSIISLGNNNLGGKRVQSSD